jgi:hypothetical protein
VIINRIKVLGLLGLPLLAIAVAVMVFAIGHSATTTQADDNGNESMSLSVSGNTFDCDPVTAGKVCVNQGAKFTVTVNADSVPPQGYILAQAWIDYDSNGLVHKKASENLWPDCEPATFLASQNEAENGASAGCLTSLLPPQPVSNYTGPISSFSLTCTDPGAGPTSHTISLLPSGDAVAGTSGALFVEHTTGDQHIPSVGSINVNCNPGPTATPTSTPPPIPRMQKCDQADNDGDTIKDNVSCSNLVNVFLTRQGAKIPNDTCLAGKGTTANVAELGEKLSADIVSPDPKDPSAFQALAAFEFEVHYDNKKVCIDINEGEQFEATGAAVCIVEDDQPDSKPQLEGVARIGCVTIGKGHGLSGLGGRLATVDVYPQPEMYSDIKPNQDNGNVVQINNVNCDLGDEQGHAIPIFSCDDADITFRFLEGDVEPDCVIDAIDAQAIAFRWGVEKGSLIYKDFMNLEPSSQQSDNDIDINDLQFVYGRFGSTCKNPHPAQDPVNPKA